MPGFDAPSPAIPRAPDLSAFVARACGVLTAGIGVAGLVGWIAGIATLTRVSTAFIPMAPSTALAFAFLGSAAFALERWPARRATRGYVYAAAVLVCVLAALVMAQFIGDFDLGLEPAVSSTAQSFHGVPVGRMSPLAAGAFLLAALSLIALTTYPSETVAGRRVAAGLGVGTLAIGAAALIGYALGSPILYGSGVVPVALPTSTGLSLLGAGILTSAIREPWRDAAGSADARRRKRPRIMRYLPAMLGAGATALLTVTAAGIARRLDQTRLQDAFEHKVQQVGTALQSSVDRGLTSIRSIAAALADDEGRELAELRPLAAASRPPRDGDFAVAWVPRVPLETRARFEAEARRDERPDFLVRELGSAGRLVAAGRRNEYYPGSSVEPSTGYEAFLGFDMASEAAAADAMTRARATGAQAMSDGFTFVADPPSRRVVVAVQPLGGARPHRGTDLRAGALRGYVVAIFPLAEVVRMADPDLASEGIVLTLRDDREEKPEPLYGLPQAAAAYPFLAHAETLEVADRRWRAVFVPTAAYRALHPQWSAWALLVGGLLFSFLVGSHLVGMERYNADLETSHEALLTSEARFRAISETALDGIITIDATGTIVHCNPAAAREFGYDTGGLLGRNVRELIPASHVESHAAGLATYAATGEAPMVGQAHEIPALRRDGSEFPIELSLATWETREGRFATAILRDITERKSGHDERERLIAELQDALANVKTLSGLMPICAWCKKIRDDQGYWTQLESYLSHHTTAEFTHGICPDCKKKFEGGDLS